MNLSPADVASWHRHLGRPVDPVALRARLVRGSLTGALARAARTWPDRTAVVVDGSATTFSELARRSAAAAHDLRAHGVQPGERVLLCAPTSVGFVTAYLAVLWGGATAVPVNPGLTVPEVRRLVTASGARLAVAGGGGLATCREAGLERLLRLDGDGPEPLLETVGDGLASAPQPPAPVAILAFTSGTTGEPKGVPLSQANLVSSIRAATLAWRWRSSDVVVHALPLYHQHGLGAVHASLLWGSASVVASRFDPEPLARDLEISRGTVLFAVPTQYRRLADAGVLRPLPQLRLAVSGSAALPEAVAGEVAERIGQPVLQRYGTTESGLDVSQLYGEPRAPGFVGLPLPGVELRIDGPAEGEVLVRGPQVFAGYEGGRPPSAAFGDDGWFRTGDIGRLDATTGELALVGRSKELIVTGGLNVHPSEVERALETHPAVNEVAVAGLPSAEWGEEVAAFVVPHDEAAVDEAAILAHARDRLAGYKCPKRVVAVTALPRGPMGKVRRDRLAELVHP